MRKRTGVLVLGATVLGIGLDPPGAGADCSGPMIEHTVGAVERGQEITVTGGGFGDNCYDTGPPPAGEGTLGHPLTGIVIAIVQDGVEHRVAVGDADADYRFEVQVVVPAGLAPGEARVEAMSGPHGAPAFDRTDEPLLVGEAPAPTPGAGEPEVVTFGPGADAPAGRSQPAGEPATARGDGSSAPSSRGEGADRAAGWIAAGLGVVALVGVASTMVLRRR
jgi:hypothetical protein